MSKRKVSEIFSSMAYGPAPEAADSAKAWIESHGGAFGHFINGAFVKPKGRKTYTSVDPCSGKALATTLVGENADIDFRYAYLTDAEFAGAHVDASGTLHNDPTAPA